MSVVQRIALILPLFLWVALVGGMPSFDGVAFWSSDTGSLVPGMGALEALGPQNNYENGYFVPRFLAVDAERGAPGNVTITSTKNPPMFYLHNSQVWLYHNATTILPVNVRNSTLSSQLPLQVVVGKQREGVRGGTWRWQGTQLIYEQGSATNQGIYYACQDTNDLMGLFLFLKP
ncbi:hypothetical protein BC835DRAFT_1264528 [Cytidiella melzeri]|nr:hypothetical protein BC835DRAFT_1264528 [Cytidiella melzeri]